MRFLKSKRTVTFKRRRPRLPPRFKDTRKNRMARRSYGSLTIRKLAGFPDKVQVKLPYTFCYNLSGVPNGTSGGVTMAMFSGNCYPNLGGQKQASVVSTVECPTNLFRYGSAYGRALVSGCSINIKASFAGTFQQHTSNTGWTGDMENIMVEPPVVALTAFPLDQGDSAGSFYWNGVASMSPRPGTVTATGNVVNLINSNLEEMMSTPNTKIKYLSSPFGGKSIASFKGYYSTKKFVDAKDLEDIDECSFSPPEAPNSNASNQEQTAAPRGFGLLLKSFVRNSASTGNGSGTDWQISGTITYYYTFSGLRPTYEQDWYPS